MSEFLVDVRESTVRTYRVTADSLEDAVSSAPYDSDAELVQEVEEEPVVIFARSTAERSKYARLWDVVRPETWDGCIRMRGQLVLDLRSYVKEKSHAAFDMAFEIILAHFVHFDAELSDGDARAVFGYAIRRAWAKPMPDLLEMVVKAHHAAFERDKE